MAKWLTLLCCLLGPLAQAEVLQDPTAPLAGSGAAVGRTRRLRCHQRGLVNWGQPHCAQSRPAR